MWIPTDWKDYKLLDCGGGERLERWGRYLLVRPDPQAIWHPEGRHPGWRRHDTRYQRVSTGGGQWVKKELPQRWTLGYKGPILNIKPMNFKHASVLPEQAADWDFVMERIRSAGRSIQVLSLFAYTGAVSVTCATAGAAVCHMDVAKGMVNQAWENVASSGLFGVPIHWIVDDCAKLVEREIRRDRRYDVVIMDPPSYGRGPSGEVWKLEENLFPFVELVAGMPSGEPLFFLISSYTTGLASSVLTHLPETLAARRYGGRIESQELGLSATATGLALLCGATGCWTVE